ncbi:18484_t:CDS:2 [Entrophospora sp. SA101]|nr:3765_t:CDS:2 [Entrophospora sp. SA101]CAJ0753751.1 18484_t:CDS:2 [Entrophospora sp. SA101]
MSSFRKVTSNKPPTEPLTLIELVSEYLTIAIAKDTPQLLLGLYIYLALSNKLFVFDKTAIHRKLTRKIGNKANLLESKIHVDLQTVRATITLKIRIHELEIIKKITGKDLWTKDLDELEKIWNTFINNDRENMSPPSSSNTFNSKKSRSKINTI